MHTERKLVHLLLAALLVGAALPLASATAGPQERREMELKRQARQEAAEARRDRSDTPPEARPSFTLDAAVRRVKRRHPRADVVGAQTRVVGDDRRVHEVKIIKQNGQVKTYRFDAITGGEIG